jgi:dihydrofolate synthase/folylpolyglutamate synthase
LKNYFKASSEVFEWISGFINLERGQTPKSFRLERMEILTELADHPEKCAPSIHIAGSKGKGSVTSMVTTILAAAGFSVARYMSPHVTDIRERICFGTGLNGVTFFDEEIYCTAGNELRHIIQEQLPIIIKTQSPAVMLFDTSTPDGCEPTFWELLTLLFFLCSRLAKCDVMIIETGMGGRLDSTNVLDPLLSIITLIELEHTKFLGETITEIAGEKAGIIKQNKPLVLAKQCDEALKVFRKKTQEKNSPLYYFPQIAEITDINITPHGTEFTLSNKDSSFNIPNASFVIPIPGKVQAENATLAIAAIKTAFPQIGEETIRKGLLNLKIPARFEKIISQETELPPFIIDGAHTPESLMLCVETFCSLYGENGVLIFGCAADKDAAAMAKIAYPHFAKIIITTPGTFKASNPEKVYEAFTLNAEQEKTILIKDTQEAIKQALDEAQKKKEKILPILGTGSFYLVSEIRKSFLSKINFLFSSNYLFVQTYRHGQPSAVHHLRLV